MNNYFVLFIFILLLLSILSCEDTTVVPLQETGNTSVLYWRAGGYAGSTDTILIIDTNRVASSRISYPPVDRLLTYPEYQSIISMCEGIDTLQEQYFGPTHLRCRDQFFEYLVVQKFSAVKIISVDECAFMEESHSPDLQRIGELITMLRDLADNIYKEDNPWKGITVEYSTNKSVYALNEPIFVTIIIQNPTNKIRTLYFQHEQKYSFVVSASAPHFFYYTYPKYDQRDSTPPSQIVLQPQGSWGLTYPWDYARDTTITMHPQKYAIHLNVLTGLYGNEFELEDPIIIEILNSEDQ